MKRTLALLLPVLPVLLAATARAGEEPRLLMDKTGLDWVAPFPAALDKAKKTKRLLLVKPIAFGTKPNGCW